MSIYTRTSADIYFLNDKNIVSSLELDAKFNINPIPSKDLLISVYNNLSGKNKDLSDYIDSLDFENGISSGGYILEDLILTDGLISYSVRKLMSSDISNFSEYITDIINSLSVPTFTNVSGTIDQISELNGIITVSFKNILSDYVVGLPEYVKSKIDELDQSTISSENKLIFAIDETDGKISAYVRNITSADFASNKILPSQVDTLVDQLNAISSNFVKKSGDEIDHLSVLNTLTALSVNVYQKSIDNHFTDVKVYDKGIYINLSGDNDRIVNLSLENSTNDIKINGISLCSHIANEVKVSSDSLIQYVKDSISALDVTDEKVNGQFVTKVSLVDGYISVERNALVSDDIPMLQEAQIQNLTQDLTTLSNDWLKKNDFNETLSGAFYLDPNPLLTSNNSFKYDANAHAIILDVKGNTLSIDSTDFIKNRTVTHVNIDGTLMYMWFTTGPDSTRSWEEWGWNPSSPGCPAKEGVDYVSINLSTLTQVYRFENGVSCDPSSLIVRIDRSKVPFFTDLNYDNKTSAGKLITSLSEINGVISYDVKDLSTSDVNGLNDYVSNAIGLSVANITSNIEISQGKISSISQADGKVSILTAWMTSSDFERKHEGTDFIPVFPLIYVLNLTNDLSSIDYKQNSMSNDISSLQTDSLRELKFDGRLIINQSDFSADKKALSTLFIEKSLAPENYIKNGSIFKIVFSEVSQSSMYETTENLHLGHGDYVIIENYAGDPPPYKIDVKDLIVEGDLKNVWMLKAGVSTYEFEAEKQKRTLDTTLISTWLSANFDNAKDLQDLTADTIINHSTYAKNDISVEGSEYVQKNVFIKDKVSVDSDITLDKSLNVTDNLISANFRNDISAVVYTNCISTDTLSVLDHVCLKSEKTNSWYKITIDDSTYGVPTFNFEKIN